MRTGSESPHDIDKHPVDRKPIYISSAVVQVVRTNFLCTVSFLLLSSALVLPYVWGYYRRGFKNFQESNLIRGPRTLDSVFCRKLFAADKTRWQQNTDYDVNIQNITRKYMRNDVAPLPLFTWVNDTKLFSGPSTFTRMIDLFDNYFLYTGQTEHLTRREIKEVRKFLDVVIATRTMKIAHKYLVNEGLASKSERAFRRQLCKMWFYFYRRGIHRDTSGFEHVFVGRRGRMSVGGYHNWVRFYLEEQAGMVDYKGHIRVTHKEPRRLTIHFTLDGVEKPIGGFFLGTSPEFEIALYTACFLKFPNGACTCGMNGQKIIIMTYRSKANPINVATAYPV